jgi:hypothetical protein
VRVQGFVSLRDLPATVMDLAVGGDASPFPGGSLDRFWSGLPMTADTLLAQTRYARGRPNWDATSRGDLQGALYDWQTFLRDASRQPELYDLRLDPGQTQNVAGNAGTDSTTALLQAFLDHRMGAPAGGPSGRTP